MNALKQYFVNWWLFLRGARWLWTRDETGRPTYQYDSKFNRLGITYRDGWGPWKFLLLVYWWDYGLAVLLGRGVQSLSRAFQLLGRDHWLRTGPILWGSVDLWD